MSGSHSTGVRIVGATVRGRGHREDNIPCQDSWAKKQLSDNRCVVAAGDGLGSANHSDVGSSVATKRVVSELEDEFSEVDTIDEEVAEEGFEKAFTRSREAVIETADARGDSVSDYGTTLVAAVLEPSRVAGAVAGDGGIAYGSEQPDDILLPREDAVVDLSAQNITIPLTHDRWRRSYRFGFEEGVNSISVFTDGLEEFTWVDPTTLNKSFFDTAFEDFIHNSMSEKESEEQLKEILTHENFDRFPDDKTLVLAYVQTSEGSTPPDRQIESLRITEVVKKSDEVTLVLSLSGESEKKVTLNRPPAWQSTNCKLKVLLETYDTDLDSIDEITGKKIPSNVVSQDDHVDITLDFDALENSKKENVVDSPDFSGVEF